MRGNDGRHTVLMTIAAVEDLRKPIIALLQHYRHLELEAERRLGLMEAGDVPTYGIEVVELVRAREFFRKQSRRFSKALDGLNATCGDLAETTV